MTSRAANWRDRPRGKACLGLYDLLKQIDANVQCERCFGWLFVPTAAERLPLEEEIIGALEEHCWDTRGNHPKKANCDPTILRSDVWINGRARTLEVDFYLPSLGLAIEFDERQHFTDERRFSLGCYANLGVAFDIERWISLCSKTIIDADPPCRDWMRAYRDAIRDVRSVHNGVRLARIYYKDFKAPACAEPGALERLESALKQ